MTRMLALSSLVVGLVGCSSTSFTGTVVDVTGAPMAGSTITVVGTTCQGKVADDGTFDLGCKPGEAHIIVANTGYVSEERTLEAPEKVAYDLGAITLTKIPESDGLWLRRDGAYEALTPGLLARLTEGPGKDHTDKNWCVDLEGGAPTKVPAGTVVMFDKAAPDWKLWKLNADGCAYTQHRIDVRWETRYAESVKGRTKEIGAEQTLVTLDLPAGSYFAADWHAGFFNAKSEIPEDGNKRYGGFYIVAE